VKVLFTGLSGAGKTTLADEVYTLLKSKCRTVRVNADKVREETNNWDFTKEGRIKQTIELKKRSLFTYPTVVLCDFIAPTKDLRELYNPDLIIYMNTVSSSKYKDTDALYDPPTNANYIVTTHADTHAKFIARIILNKFDGVIK
jgi:adenylylsulfate kinase